MNQPASREQGAVPAGILLGAYLGLLGALLVPLFTAKVPPLADYPNHMARIHILSDAGRSPILRAFYSVNWHVTPVLGLELVTLPLVRLFGLDLAGRLFLAIIFVLVSSGTVALYKSLHGRVSFWPLISLLFLYNHVFIWGFLSYLLGVGLALWTFAAWIRLRGSSLLIRWPLFFVLSFGIFLAHLAAFGLFILLLAAYEFAHRLRKGDSLQFSGRNGLLSVFAPTLPAFAAILSWSHVGVASGGVQYAAWRQKIWALSVVTELYSERLALIVALGLLVLSAALLVGRRIFVDSDMIPGCILVAVSYVVMPQGILGGYYADMRLLVSGVFVFLGSTTLRATRRAEVWGLVAVCVLGLAQARFIERRWRGFDRTFEGVLAACDRLPKGARLLSVVAHWGPWEDRFAPPLMHAGSLCVISRDAFVPTLFALGAQQPIHLTPPFEALAKITPYPLFMPRDLGRLSEAGPADPLNPFAQKLLENYDFVLVFHEELFPFPVPKPFHLLESDEPVSLYGRTIDPE